MKYMPMSKACVDGDISWVKDNNIPSRKGIWGLENTTMKEHVRLYKILGLFPSITNNRK